MIISSTYEVIEQIGAGGGGIVYLAQHLRLNKKVVLKADKRKVTTRPEILRREVDVLKNLSHTYIPQVYDYFIEDDTVYTVIDYIEGESLDKALKRGERFSQAQVIIWASELLEALIYLHSPIHGDPPKGIVHSDIKPANIMRTAQGHICLIDFNIALALGEENVVGLSAGYASPEHYGIDFSSDSSFINSKTTAGIDSTFSRVKNSNRSVTSQSIESDKQEYTSTMPMQGGCIGDDSTATMPREGNNAGDSTVTMSMQGNNTGDNTVTMNTGSTTISMDMDRTASMDNRDMVTMSMKPQQTSTTSGKRIVIPDARSDIYSLGATLYHLLSGNRPARKATEVVKLSKKEFSPLIVDIITKAMNPNPDLRYQSAEEMLYDFLQLRQKDPRTIARKKAAVAASVVAGTLIVAGVCSTFLGLKRIQTEDRLLNTVEYAQNALNDGDMDKAVEYALEALPQKGIFTGEYLPQARKALTDSLDLYNLGDGYKPHKLVNISTEAIKLTISPSGKYGAVMSAFQLNIFECESGKIINSLPMIKSALADVVFVNDDLIVYGGEKGITLYSLSKNAALWTGKEATHITVSADGSTIAVINRDESFATVYSIDGTQKTTVDFNGKKQKVVINDVFGDPEDNLIALSNDGKLLAVSFEDGGLELYDLVNPDEGAVILENSDYTHFEGNFTNGYFAFSGYGDGSSCIYVLDLNSYILSDSSDIEGYVGLKVYNGDIYIYNGGLATIMDPATFDQQEVLYVDADIKAFSVDDKYATIITQNNDLLLYDKNANLLDRHKLGKLQYSFVNISGDYIICASRDSKDVKIFKAKTFENANVFSYDASIAHDEARIREDNERVMLFDYKQFTLYDKNGTIIKQQDIPDNYNVYDQQYHKASGNLAVIYNDGFTLYSGDNGEPIYDVHNLKSVLYTPFGVSVYDGSSVKLIDLATGQALEEVSYNGSYGVFCGTLVGDEIVMGGKVIGAAKTDKGYLFAVQKDNKTYLYDDSLKKLFSVTDQEYAEAFFIENAVILSPLQGTTKIYSTKNGKLLTAIEDNSFLTYVNEYDNYVVAQFFNVEGIKYAMLLDKEGLAPVAYIPDICDVGNDGIIIDTNRGDLRKTRIYPIEEIIDLGREEKNRSNS